VNIHAGEVVKSLGMIDQGRSEAFVTFAKTFFSQNELALINVRLDNMTCDKELKDINVKLVRSIEYLSLPTKTEYIYDVLNEETFYGVQARKYEEKTLQLMLCDKKSGTREIVKENKWNSKEFELEDIVLQNYLPPSVNATLVKCHYFIELSFVHNAVTFVNEIPKIIFPIYLFAPEVTEYLH